MLRFFRTIRKKLIEDLPSGQAGDDVRKPASPTGRYLLYAIGEVLLVVIGIILALQVNNWNEERKESNLAITYLSSLKEDLVLDIEKFEYQIEDLSFQLSQIDSLEEILSEPSFSNSDFNELIKNNLDIIQTFEDANLNNNTFMTLQNTGRVDLLDEAIQFRLLDLNSLQKVYRVMINDNLQLKYNVSEDFISEVPFYFPDMKVHINPAMENEIWDKVNWDNAQRKFYTLLNTMKVVNVVGIEITEELKLETEELLSILNSLK